MTTQSIFDYATPFDIMVGIWNGLCTCYSPEGEYVCTFASFVAIYWHTPNERLHFRQIETNLDEVLNINSQKIAQNIRIALKNISVDFDFDVKGKSCKSRPSLGGDAKCIGAETKPGSYIFSPMYKEGTYYNNQYFTSPNDRCIIGPYVEKGQVEPQSIFAQTFSRISYDVPEKYRVD